MSLPSEASYNGIEPELITDSQGIMYRRWAVAEPKAIVLLVHGLGGHTGRWVSLSGDLNNCGIELFGLELRGFGLTQGVKGHIGSFSTYYRDISRLYDIIREAYPEQKIFLLGESLGALICFLMAQKPGQCGFAGLICISPAFKSRLKFRARDYLKIVLLVLLSPRKLIKIPLDPQMCTRDLDFQGRMQSDEREHRMASVKLLVLTFIQQWKTRLFPAVIRMPVFFLLAGMDMIVDSQESERIFRRLKSAEKTLKVYPELCHALSIENGKEQVFQDIKDWINTCLK